MINIQINSNGICSEAKFIASPNIDTRPKTDDICLIVIHNISLPPNEYGGNGVIELFTNKLNPDEHPYYAEIAHLKVSSHFFIRRDGEPLRFDDPNIHDPPPLSCEPFVTIHFIY